MNRFEKFFREPFDYEELDTCLEKIDKETEEISILNYIKKLSKKER